MSKIRQGFDIFINRLEKKPGQAFVEFALALPILLMLLFGIIEFGRLMQAYLAMENGARFAVRYAVTGTYDPKYCAEAATALGLTDDDNADGNLDCVVPDIVDDYLTKTEQLQDWARLPSIRDVALAGATGIAYSTESTVSGDYRGYLAAAYGVPAPGLDSTNRGNPSLAGYFSISICSNRVTLPDENSYVLNPNPFYYTGHNNEAAYKYPVYCELIQKDGSTVRYVDDAGGPGNRVKVILTYRHTLITPLLNSWWPTLLLTSEREGIVEKFRNSRITGLSSGIAFAATWTLTPTITQTPTESLTPTMTVPSSTATVTATITPIPSRSPTITNTPTITPASCAGTGGVLHEWWTGISGTSLSALTGSSLYPNEPTGHDVLTLFEGPTSFGDNYGARYRAYVCAPYDGVYTFSIASDDYSSLLLSSGTSPASATQIAYINGYTSSRQWTKYPATQKSTNITLTAGQLYYIEALMKEGTGGDNLAVGWTGPGIGSTTTVIDGDYLVPFETTYANTRTPTPTKTGTSTRTPTTTPAAGCDMAVFNTSEGLVVRSNRNLFIPMYDSSTSYNISITGVSGQWTETWHDNTRSQDVVNVLQRYDWYNGSTNTMYSIPSASYVTLNSPTVSWTHTFSSAYQISTGTSHGVYLRFASNWSRAITGFSSPGYSGSDLNYDFYHGSDFSVTINYTVGGQSCQQTVTGDDGPVLSPSRVNGTEGSFSVNAGATAVRDGVRRVIFNVFDSGGNLVHAFSDESGPYCLFGGTSSCDTLQPFVDNWSTGTQITNGTYTVSIVAEDDSSTGYYYSTRQNFTLVLNASTPTRTPTSTNTQTSTVTRTPTITETPTRTSTVTRTPSVTRTPTVTNTLTVTRTPTRTETPTVTSTPTRTRTFTSTSTVTSTYTVTRTPTKTSTPTSTSTGTATRTSTVTRTPTITLTPTLTNTTLPTSTRTPTMTKTPCLTPIELGGCH